MSETSEPLRVILADDHNLVRSGIRALLESMPGVQVVAEADDGDLLLEKVRQFEPDVVITDISMRRLSGLDALARIIDDWPACRVVVLSMYDNPEFVQQALRAGAAAYLLKDAAVAELGLALAAVARGERYLSPRISTQLVEQMIKPAQPAEGPASLSELTPRQTEILKLIARGRATKQIAFDLDLSVKTVETHRSHLMERLGIREVAGLVRYAVRHGLVDLDGT